MPTSLKETATTVKKAAAVKPAAQEDSGLMSLLDGDMPAEAAPEPKKPAAPKKAAKPSAVASEQTEEGSGQKVAKPENKAQVTKMTVPQLDALTAQEGISIPNWDALSVADKKAAVAAALFPDTKGNTKGKLLLNDPMSQLQHEIETLDDADEIDKIIREVIKNEGVNDFRLGGLFARLNSVKVFEDGQNFKTFVLDVYGVQYRKAMYLIANYNAVVGAELTWDDVQELGWTKLAKIVPVLTKDNAKEWIEKAKAVNASTLMKLVAAAMKEGVTDLSDTKVQKNFKTRTFQLPEDEVEGVDEAIEHAMKLTSTDAKGIALSYVCNEYLNSAGDKKQSVSAANHQKVVAELEDKSELVKNLQTQLADAEQQLANGAQTSLRDMFDYLKATHGGIKQALQVLLGEEFDAAFPGVVLDVDVSAVAEDGEPQKKPAKKAAKKAA